jgi:hypothetical protein
MAYAAGSSIEITKFVSFEELSFLAWEIMYAPLGAARRLRVASVYAVFSSRIDEEGDRCL